MTRRLAVIAVTAVLAWMPAAADARPYGGGRYYSNPYTGAHASAGTAYNPYTGRDVSTQKSYNPYTNTYSRSVEATNPYTGRSAAVGGAYRP
jgi:hypothetical protein